MNNKKKMLTIGVIVILCTAVGVRFAYGPRNTIVGKWKMKGIGVATGQAEVADITMIKEFNSDGTETETIGAGSSAVTYAGTYKVTGNAVTETLHGDSSGASKTATGPHLSTFNIDGNTLTLSVASGIAHTSEDFERIR